MDMERLLFLAVVIACGLGVLQLAIWIVGRACKALAARIRQLLEHLGTGGRHEAGTAPYFRH